MLSDVMKAAVGFELSYGYFQNYFAKGKRDTEIFN